MISFDVIFIIIILLPYSNFTMILLLSSFIKDVDIWLSKHSVEPELQE